MHMSPLYHSCGIVVRFSAEVAKNVSRPWLPLLRGCSSLTMTFFLVNLTYIEHTILSCSGSVPLPNGYWDRW